MGGDGSYKSVCPSPEVEPDGSPVNQMTDTGLDLFRFMAEAAVDQGYISSEGLSRVMTALNREVSND